MLRRLSTVPGRSGREIRARTLTTQRVLAATLLAAAVVVLAGALVLPDALVGLGFIALALALAAATSWRISGRIARQFQESNAWAEVGQLRSMLAQRDAVWSDLPAPVAVWDSQGQLVLASLGWQRLGLPTDAAPYRFEYVQRRRHPDIGGNQDLFKFIKQRRVNSFRAGED